MNRSLLTRGGLALAAVALAGGGAGVAGAQGPIPDPPQLTITSTGKAVAVTGPTAAGAVELVLGRGATPPVAPTVFRMKPGKTVEDLEAAAKRVERGLGPVTAISDFVASAFVPGPRAARQRIVLRPGSYVAADIAGEPGKAPMTGFEVTGTATPAPLPPAAAEMALREYRFAGPSVLERGSWVRFSHEGDEPHEVAAVPVPRGSTSSSVRRDLRRGKEPKRVEPVVGLVTKGAQLDARLDLKAGRYVLVCLYGDRDSQNKSHARLGMAKTVRVR